MNRPERTGVCAGKGSGAGRAGPGRAGKERAGQDYAVSPVPAASISGGSASLPPRSDLPDLPGPPGSSGSPGSQVLSGPPKGAGQCGTSANAGIAVYAFTAKGAALGARLAELFAGRGRKTVLHLSAGASGALGVTDMTGVAGPGANNGAGSAPEPEAMPQVATAAPEAPAGAGPVLFSGLHDLLSTTFQHYGAHIFIGAAGIAVRGIAPFLNSKSRDPAALVLDQQGRHVISLLSGHLGGGNALCFEVAELLGAAPVISTATDLENLPAIDLLAREAGLQIANLEAVKAVSAAALDGRPVWVDDPGDWLPQLRPPVFRRLSGRSSSLTPLCRQVEPQLAKLRCQPHQGSRQGPHQAPEVQHSSHSPYSPLVRVSHLALPTAPDILLLHPANLWVGLGCKRGVPAKSLKNALEQLFARLSLALRSLAGFASIDRKSDESGLLELAQDLALPLRFFSAEELAAVPTPSFSPKAMELFGAPGVAEAAALLAARQDRMDRMDRAPAASLPEKGKDHSGVEAELLCPKQIFAGITLAVARRGSGNVPARTDMSLQGCETR